MQSAFPPLLEVPAFHRRGVPHVLAGEQRWYAVHTRANHERGAADVVRRRGIEVYLPSLFSRSRRRDRVLYLDRPLFPSYFFARFRATSRERIDVLSAHGVARILGNATAPASVPDWQIDSLRAALGSGSSVEVRWNLVPGRRVRVVDGALAGVEGVVLTEPDGRRRLFVSIELLGRSLAVQMAREHVEPVV
jgi:transcriptional antiterminator RfaH